MDTVDMENGVRSNERITLSREVKQGTAGPADGRVPPIRTPTQDDPGSRAQTRAIGCEDNTPECDIALQCRALFANRQALGGGTRNSREQTERGEQ